MKNTVQTSIKASLIFSVLVLLVFVLQIAYDSTMLGHCNNLVHQSKSYNNFFVTALDKEECSVSYGIEVDAPVR